MFEDVKVKYKRKNKTLFSQDSECLQKLVQLIEMQSHRTLVMWALDCAKVPLGKFEEKYPEENRPRLCLSLCEDWARGKIKMGEARHAILNTYAVAKEIDDPLYEALCHAIGQAGATVHTEKHAIGLPMYELSAIVLEYGIENFERPVSDKISFYQRRLLYWQEHTDEMQLEWAKFLLDDNK